MIWNVNLTFYGQIFVASKYLQNVFRMIRGIKRGRMIPILPWFELYFEKWPKIISRTPNAGKNFFSSHIQNNLKTLYAPPKVTILNSKFQKISITRGRKIFFSSQIRNNLNTFYPPPKARILFRNPVKSTWEPVPRYARL